MSNKLTQGFTLVELMIVVTIIGILSALALPAYQGYATRTKIAEILVAGSGAKNMMSEAFQTGGITAMSTTAANFNAKPQAERQSKYLSDVIIDEASPWTITMVLNATAGNGLPTPLNGTTLTLSPNVQGFTPTAGSIGAIDWACASTTANISTIRGFTNIVLGTLPSQFAPFECR